MSAEKTLRLSNSEMKVFRCDPRHWYLSVYRRLAKIAADEPMSTLSVGNYVHDCLAAWYDQDDSIDPRIFAEKIFQEKLEEYGNEFEKELTKEFEFVKAMMDNYMQEVVEGGQDADLRIIGSERMVEVNLAHFLREPGETIGGYKVTLLSKLDAPVERISDGARLALEHKTVSNLDQHMPLLKSDTQFLTEHLARFLHSIEGGMSSDEAMQDCQGILLNCLRRVKGTASAKPPFFGRTDVPHNIYELRNHFKHVCSTARAIIDARERLDAGESHHDVCPPNPTRESTYLNPFLRVYAIMDDGSDIEGALRELYVERDPLERYFNAIEL